MLGGNVSRRRVVLISERRDWEFGQAQATLWFGDRFRCEVFALRDWEDRFLRSEECPCPEPVVLARRVQSAEDVGWLGPAEFGEALTPKVFGHGAPAHIEPDGLLTTVISEVSSSASLFDNPWCTRDRKNAVVRAANRTITRAPIVGSAGRDREDSRYRASASARTKRDASAPSLDPRTPRVASQTSGRTKSTSMASMLMALPGEREEPYRSWLSGLIPSFPLGEKGPCVQARPLARV